MRNTARITLTASMNGQAVTEMLLSDILADERLSALKDFSKVAFVEKGTAFPNIPRHVFGVEVDNQAFGKDLVGGADRAALELMHIIREQGVDITPCAIISHRHGEFHRNTGLDTTFSDPARPFNTYESPATELTLRPGTRRPQTPTVPMPKVA